MATISEALAVAIQHHQAGRLQAAEQIYRQILRVEPNHADAWHLLGLMAYQLGKHEAAVPYLRRAIGLKGTESAYHNNLGGVYWALRRIPEAVACYRRAVELKPNYAEALYNLGNALADQGKPDEAIACYQRALELKPDFAGAHNNLGNALKDQGKLDEAIACFRLAVQSKPDYAEAHYNLGNALKDQGKLDEALACYHRALTVKPDHTAALGSLVTTLQHLCRWEDLNVLSARLIEVVQRDADGPSASPVSPFTFFALPTTTTAEQQLRCARHWVDRTLKAVVAPGPSLAGRRASGFRPKITLGYLSADFHAHATAYLIAELFEKHDRQRFDAWMGLLRAVPGSVLWLFEGNRFASANLRHEAEARGVAAERLVFAPRQPLAEHLARHRLADLFLDTFPVNAHTTASDALWAGCPVLTLAGETFASRVAGSLLRTLGLPELVTNSLDAYQAMASRLARNADLLAQLRARLEANRATSPLFDGGRFARNLEKAYLTMWDIYASGEKPIALEVSPA